MIKLKWGEETGITVPKEANKKEICSLEKKKQTGNLILQSELVWSHTQASGSNKSWKCGSPQLLSCSVVTGLPVELYMQMISD